MDGTQNFVVLYSDRQDAYHVERIAEYEQKGAGPGNYRIVAYCQDYVSGLNLAHERRIAKKDTPK